MKASFRTILFLLTLSLGFIIFLTFIGKSFLEINETNLKSLDVLNLNVLLTPGRRNGVYSMLLKIKEHAKSHCK